MESQIYEMVVDFISRLGFPIFVAVWMLWRDSKRMQQLIEAVEELTKAVDALRISRGA